MLREIKSAERALNAVRDDRRQKDEEYKKMRDAILDAEAVLSEMGLSAEDKCQMAYDFLTDIEKQIGRQHE